MDVRLHEHEADRLASLRSYHVLDSAPDEAFDMLTRLAARVCDAPISMISLVDQDRQWFLSRHGVESTEDPRSASVCSDVVAAGAALVIPDLSRTPRYADLAAVVGEPGYRAYAGTPLVGRDGLALGTLCVIDTEARDFDAGQLGALDDLAAQVVAAMELRRYDDREGLTAPAMVPEARQPVTLRRALDNHEFVPFYQPIVDMRSGAVVGLEALVRWQHPTRGLLTPDAFLPGLETGTLALWTARAVLETSCQVRVDLRYRGLVLPEGVAVNLSGRQLANPGLAAQILAALARHGLPGTGLTLEITETAGLTDIGLARQELLTLRAAGVRIVADDFGVGWSNLTRLLQLPLTGLKIDRELVTGMVGDRVREHMVSSAIALAATMGLSVVAEGVESEAVRDRLLALGCRRGQGWLFSRALPAADLAAALAWQQEHRQVALRPQPRRFERVPVTGLAAIPPDGPAAPAESLADAVLDALPDSTAVLDVDGVVVAVNRAWRMFTVDNDGRPDATGVGVSYLDVCARAMAAGCPEAAGVLEGLRAVLAGETVQYDSEYPCSSPEVRRWFLLRMTPLGGPAGGAVLSHVNITRRQGRRGPARARGDARPADLAAEPGAVLQAADG